MTQQRIYRILALRDEVVGDVDGGSRLLYGLNGILINSALQGGEKIATLVFAGLKSCGIYYSSFLRPEGAELIRITIYSPLTTHTHHSPLTIAYPFKNSQYAPRYIASDHPPGPDASAAKALPCSPGPYSSTALSSARLY
jgi:hypothetical protein